MNGLFITATDTGVGKTWVACALARAAARRGLRVSVMKPCETGDGDDGARLLDAAGRPLDAALARPYQFHLPASPEVAARAEGAAVDVARIEECFARLTRDADFTIVEGAGGLLVPVAPGQAMADLARRLALPLLIVARAALGTVNHTLLTIEAARARQLPIAGVVLCRAVETSGPEEPTNPEAIAAWGRVPILGLFPHGRDADAVADRVLDQIQPRAR